MAEKSQRGTNLTRQDRERGGRESAAKQERDSRGQFAGTRKGAGSSVPGPSRSTNAGGSAASPARGRSDGHDLETNQPQQLDQPMDDDESVNRRYGDSPGHR